MAEHQLCIRDIYGVPLIASAEASYIVYPDEYGKQGRFEDATAAYQKILETQLKVQREDCLYDF
ncbi:hypothetical protein Saga11_21250 [Bacillus safensis]|nr:hypothetical protein Saga11_21250 [Bacillus safensis]